MRRPTDTRIELSVTIKELEQVKTAAARADLSVPNYIRWQLDLPLREHRGFQHGNTHARKGRKK